jgi:hypothetical protein
MKFPAIALDQDRRISVDDDREVIPKPSNHELRGLKHCGLRCFVWLIYHEMDPDLGQLAIERTGKISTELHLDRALAFPCDYKGMCRIVYGLVQTEPYMTKPSIIGSRLFLWRCSINRGAEI